METHRPTLISAVLPAYDESEGLPIVIAALMPVLAATGFNHEIIVVDDGSADRTREVMLGLCARHPCLRYIRLSRNFGKEAALSAGLKAADGDVVILMDSDGQHPPSLIPVMIEQWQQGFEAVAAVQETRTEFMGQASIQARLLPPHGSWQPCGHRARRRRFPAPRPQGGRCHQRASRAQPPDEGALCLGRLPHRIRALHGRGAHRGPYEIHLGTAFPAGLHRPHLIHRVPLRLVSVSGMVISFTSLVYGFYLLFEHVVQGDHLPGWATLSVGMMFLSGVQLLALGVIGEYLGRTFEEAKQRPVLHRGGGQPEQGRASSQRPRFTMRVPAWPMQALPEKAGAPDKPTAG